MRSVEGPSPLKTVNKIVASLPQLKLDWAEAKDDQYNFITIKHNPSRVRYIFCTVKYIPTRVHANTHTGHIKEYTGANRFTLLCIKHLDFRRSLQILSVLLEQASMKVFKVIIFFK